jgi:CRISPR-associated protein Csm5
MRYTLEVLSPLHVGSGNTISPLEYALADKFYRADMDKLFEDERFNTDKFIEGAKRGTLYLGRFAPELAKEHVRYALDIADSTKTSLQGLIGSPSSDVREYIKTKEEVYIPGSSIKGAIRTAILWWVLKTNPDKFNRAKNILRNLVRSRDRVDKKRVDDQIEEEVFGKDPTHDLLKVLQVSDTHSVDAERLRIEEVRTLTTMPRGHNWKGFYTFVEAFKPKTILDFEIKIDEFWLEGEAARELHFESKGDYVRELPRICNEFADDLIQHEIEFFKRYNAPRELDNVLDYYERERTRVKEASFLLHLSWGSGWHGMTVGRLLESDLLRDLRRKFGLGKAGVPEFPKTRRLVFEDGKPKYPLGWVKVSLKNK